MKPTRKRATRLLAFGPALVMICVTAYVASGASVVGSASAVSTAGVSATVNTAGSSDPDVSDGTCAGESTAGVGEALAAGWESALRTTGGCLITFWTNDPQGATVSYANDFGDGTFFCLDTDPAVPAVTRDCSADNTRAEDAATTAGGEAIANGDDEFGIALTALSGGGGITNGSGAEASGTLVANPGVGDAVWRPIENAAAELCETTTSNTAGTLANCTFRLGGSGEGATQGAGNYYGRAVLTITQN